MSILAICRIFAICGVLLAGPAAAAASADSCPAPEDATSSVASLPHVAAALQPGKKMTVLAIGSATMFGPEASQTRGTLTSQILGGGPLAAGGPGQTFSQQPSESAFPMQMAKQLRVMVPGADVQVAVRGGRGLLATEMLALLRTELAATHYDLVIWQTGTVEAVRNLPPGEFGQTLVDGTDATQAAGTDLVLVDPQFSRFLQANSNLDPYLQALQQVAAMPDVVLFHRFDLMRGWASEGQIDLEHAARSDRQKAIETLHACLGRSLARLVLESARI